MASGPVAGARLEARSPCGAPCSVAAWLVSRKPGVPAGPLLPPGLIFFSLDTLSGRGRCAQGVKAWMPPCVSWLEFPACVMETGLEEGGSIWCHPVWLGLGEDLGSSLQPGSLGGLWVAGALRWGRGAWGLMPGFH